MVCGYTTPQSLITQIQSGLSVSQGAFEYNGMGWGVGHFQKSPQPVWKKFSFRYPVLELLDYKII